MANLGRLKREEPAMSVGTYRQHTRAMDQRGGLSIREQQIAKRMAATGSNAITIRVELGGRYSVAQIEQALK